MSHLICSQIFINDLDILKKAVAGFGGLEWNEGAITFSSYDETGKTKSEFGLCQHSISVEDTDKGYQIGVIKRNDGQGWSLAFDPLDHGLLGRVGKESSKLVAAYSEAYIRDFAERSGFILEQTTDDYGNTVLSMSK